MELCNFYNNKKIEIMWVKYTGKDFGARLLSGIILVGSWKTKDIYLFETLDSFDTLCL